MAYCQSNVLVPLTMSETNRCTVFNDTYLKEGSRDNLLFNQVIAVTQFFASTYLCLAVGVYELRNRKRSRTARVNQQQETITHSPCEPTQLPRNSPKFDVQR